MAAVAIRDGLLYVGGQARGRAARRGPPASRAAAAQQRTRLLPQASLAQLGALGVMRVISLGAPPTAPALAQDACLCVHLVDDESADLLSQLPACVAFAQQAARDGAPLLVACHAGARCARQQGGTCAWADEAARRVAQACRAAQRWPPRC
jgi:hypothetical protein